MSKPIAYFMVVIRRSFWTRLFGWAMFWKVNVNCRTRGGHNKPFRAKVGSVYTLETRDVALNIGRLEKYYRLLKFKNMAQVRLYLNLQKRGSRK